MQSSVAEQLPQSALEWGQFGWRRLRWPRITGDNNPAPDGLGPPGRDAAAAERDCKNHDEQQSAALHFYLVAYSGGSDCNPSTQSTVTCSSFFSNIVMVAFGLTAGSTR